MDTNRFHNFKAGASFLKKLVIPNAAGNPASVADGWLWIDTTAGKLAVRISGSTVLVPLASELGSGGLTQEQIEDLVAALIQDNADIDWTYTDNGASAGALVGVIKNDAITYAKIQNVTSARVLGRITAGSGDAEELTAANLRTILGTFDADTLGGMSAAAIQSAVISAISNGASSAYDTLIEIQSILQADDTALSGLTTAVGLRARFYDGAITSGSATADVVHGYTLTNIGAFTAKCYIAATGVEEEYSVYPKSGSTSTTLTVEDESGGTIPTGRRIFVTVGA